MKIFVHKDGQQHGPFTLEELRTSVSSGAFSASDLCWHTGLEGWQPASALLDPQPPPLAGSAATHGTKTDPLSIWSLVLGILSFLCFSLLAGIPAIICGHVSLGRLKKNALLRGKGMAIAGLIMGYVSLVCVPVQLGMALPAMSAALEKGQATQKLNNARQIQLALQTVALDRAASGKQTIGWPADAGLNSVEEVKIMLIEAGYMAPNDAEKLGFENFLIGNVLESDPPETIIVKSRNPDEKLQIIFKKGGDGALYRKGQTDPEAQDPPRSPAYLE